MRGGGPSCTLSQFESFLNAMIPTVSNAGFTNRYHLLDVSGSSLLVSRVKRVEAVFIQSIKLVTVPLS